MTYEERMAVIRQVKTKAHQERARMIRQIFGTIMTWPFRAVTNVRAALRSGAGNHRTYPAR